MRLAERIAAGPRNAAAEAEELDQIFAGWGALPAAVGGLAGSFPLAADGDAAAAALARLGAIGRQALSYLNGDGAPDAWKAATRAELDTLAKPQGLLRIVGTEAVRILVDAT